MPGHPAEEPGLRHQQVECRGLQDGWVRQAGTTAPHTQSGPASPDQGKVNSCLLKTREPGSPSSSREVKEAVMRQALWPPPYGNHIQVDNTLY